MKKLIASFLAGSIALACAALPVHAQSTQSALQGQITNTLPDNSTGAISPLIVRNMLNAMVLSSTCAGTNQIIYWNASLLPTCSASPVIGTQITVPLIIGGTTSSSTLTLESTSGAGATDAILFKTGPSQATRWTIDTSGNFLGAGLIAGGSAASSALTIADTSSVSPTTSSVKFRSSAGMNYAPTMNAGSGGNNPWEFKAGTLNIFNTGKWFWTTGTPITTDTVYNCSTPLTIPNQPLTQDTTFNFCGTYTNSTGSPQFSNMLSATCYVEGGQLDVNCAAFTTVARVAGTGGAGLIGVGKSEAQTGVAHGIELEANCHSPGTNCDQARASMFLVGGGNGGLANLAFQSWRSGAAANSVRHGIYLGDGVAINPFQDTGSAVMDSAGTHVRFDYGIDFRAATVNTCAFASPGGFCITGAGDITTTGTAWTQTTPTATCTSGTLTSASTTMRRKTIGKSVFISITVTITTNGTCAGGVVVPLPFTAASRVGITGRAEAVSGKTLGADVNGTNVTIFNYDNTYPGANGEILAITGVLEST